MAVQWVVYVLGQPIDRIVAERGDPDRAGLTFSDTSDPDIMAAFRLGILSGPVAPSAGSPGIFAPNDTFSREMAAAMTMNICRAVGANVSNAPDAGFGDMGQASAWAHPGINFCAAQGIIRGFDGNFNPHGTFTRQDSIMMINNIRKQGDGSPASDEAGEPYL